jgi:hypothetical protein
MSVSKTLKSRWRSGLDKHPAAVIIRKHFDRILESADKLAAERSRLAADNTLSDIGRAQKLQKVAAEHAAPIAKAIKALAAGHDAVQKQRVALTPTVKDKSDVTSALLRQEIRASLRASGKAYQTAAAPDADPIIVEAVFEAPHTISGITKEQRDHLLAAVVERTAGPAVAAINDQVEALSLLNAALRVSTESVRVAAEVAPHAFDKWLAETAPIDTKEFETEAAAFAAQAIGETAKGLPLAQRKNLIDQLLAANVAEIKR